jgi:hypothetical protein
MAARAAGTTTKTAAAQRVVCHRDRFMESSTARKIKNQDAKCKIAESSSILILYF